MQLKKLKKPLEEELLDMISYWENKEISEEAQDSLKTAREALVQKKFSEVCNFLGCVYLMGKEFAQAKRLFNKVNYYAEKENDPIAYALSLLNLGELHTETGEILYAELDFIFCGQLLKDLGYSSFDNLLLRDQAELYIRYGMLDQAEQYVDKIIEKNLKEQKYYWDSIPQWIEDLIPLVQIEHQLAVRDFINKTSNKIHTKILKKGKQKYVKRPIKSRNN